MKRINPWPLLRGGTENREQGLRLVEQAYHEQPYASEAMALGVALLWLGRYTDAHDHFRGVIDTNPRAGDNVYGMVGVAKWCLGEFNEAVFDWRAGLKAKYARASGIGIRMPLLLFFAAVRQPMVFDRELAERLLREKASDIRIANWPGPIAKLLLDQISETQFQNCCKGIRPNDTDKNPFARHSPQETSNCLWLAEFYRSVLSFQQRELSDFQNSMKKLSDTNQPEWQDEKNIFTARVWCEEFFLARHEAAK